MKEYRKYGFVINGIAHVSPRETIEMYNMGAIIVDVRETYLNRYKTVDLTNVIYMPNSTFKENFNNLPIDKYLIFIDSVGLRSVEAAKFLIENGINNVANMAGGIVDWERDCLPISVNKSYRLIGSCMCQLKPQER